MTQFKPVDWSDPMQPTDDIRYDHVTGTTPFGNFLITWKGWKKYDMPTVDQTPWGEFGGQWNDVEDAKRMAEMAYLERLNDCLVEK